MKRREFIRLVGGTALTVPRTAFAQTTDRKRRIGVLMPYGPDDPQAQARFAAFLDGLHRLGWTVGENLQIDYRWYVGNEEMTRRGAAELVALAPDLIFASGSAAVGPLRAETQTVPILFVLVPDPVGAGYVDSLAQPGGNATGFTSYEYGIGAKWLQILKEVAPNITRVAVIRDPLITAGIGLWGAIQSVSPNFAVELTPINVRERSEIERGLNTFGSRPNGGLILTGSALALVYRNLIIALAARYGLPAVYYERFFAVAGGLVSYGSDSIEQCRQAASYADRILKGTRPADLPVQVTTDYKLAINLKTAKALALQVPTSLLARADEVIE